MSQKTKYAKLLKEGNVFKYLGWELKVVKVVPQQNAHMVDVHYEVPGFANQILPMWADTRVRLV